MQNSNEDSKVVSLFNTKSPSKKDAENDISTSDVEISLDDNTEEESFLNVMKRNQEVQDRLKRERLKANQAVLKSYRIKN